MVLTKMILWEMWGMWGRWEMWDMWGRWEMWEMWGFVKCHQIEIWGILATQKGGGGSL